MKEKKKSVRVRDWDWALGVKVVIHVVAFYPVAELLRRVEDAEAI